MAASGQPSTVLGSGNDYYERAAEVQNGLGKDLVRTVSQTADSDEISGVILTKLRPDAGVDEPTAGDDLGELSLNS